MRSMAPVEYRSRLLAILSRLDRMETAAQEILSEPGDWELGPRAEEIRELIVEM